MIDCSFQLDYVDTGWMENKTICGHDILTDGSNDLETGADVTPLMSKVHFKQTI